MERWWTNRDFIETSVRVTRVPAGPAKPVQQVEQSENRLGENDVINFNAGDHRVSVSMRYADYVRVEKPELGTVAE